MVCRQHVLTASRSPEQAKWEKAKISLHHLDLNHRPLDFWSGTTLSHHPGGIDIFALSIYILLLIDLHYNRMSEELETMNLKTSK